MKKSRKQNNRNAYQVLEPRKMLAGNVTATVSDGLLQIIGDTEGNEIIVVGAPDGTARVIGINDTTINGGTDPFVVSTKLDDVDVKLNAGDDNATIQGLVLSQSLRIRTHAGNDTTNVHHIDVRRFEQFAGDGDDKMEFNNVYSRGWITISGENNDDIVSITNMAAGNNASVLTGNGNDTVAIDNMGVKENFNLNTGNGDDQVIMTGLVYGYRANLLLEQGNDSLNVLPATSNESALFLRGLNIQAGEGNDSVAMDASVSSPKQTIIGGGAGTDSIEQGDANLRNGPISDFENQQVANLNALLDSVYTALTDADIDTEPFGRAVVVEPVEAAITATSTALIQNENGGPRALDDALTLVGDNTTYTGATVSLGDTFVSGQDVLAFTDNSSTDSITGTFDSTTGALTLTGDGTPAEYQAALRSITFNNTSEDPDVTARTATITVTRAGEADLTATRDITVVAFNDAPVVARTSSTVDVNLDDNPTRPVPIGTDALTISDSDTTQLSGAVVTIDDGRVAGDVLAFTAVEGITGSYAADTGVLTFTGDADVADYQTVLRSVTLDFAATVAAGQRRVTFETTDAEGDDSETSTAIEVLVNVFTDASARLQASDNAQPFFREAGAPVNIDTGVTVAAADGVMVSGAQVEITSGLDTANDVLTYDRRFAKFAPSNGQPDSRPDVPITISTNERGLLTFTGDATPAEYERLLRSIAYHSNDQSIDDNGQRVVQFTINSDTDFAISRTVTVEPRTEADRAESIADRDERLIQEYIAANNLTTQTTASGLHYIVETEGNGQFPSATDRIQTDYVGTYLNNVRFDGGTINGPGTPVDQQLTLQGVIAGWTEGFQLFSPGGKGKLLIPSRLAYGNGTSSSGTIARNSVLIFDIDFIENLSTTTSASS